jgi:hypothetical protein
MLRRANQIINIKTFHGRRLNNLSATAGIVTTTAAVTANVARIHGRRSYAAAAAAATNRTKRALNEQQLQGAPKPPTPSPPTGSTAAAAPPSGNDGGGGSGTTLAMVAVLAAVGGGAAYYFDMFPGMAREPKQEEPVTVVEADVVTTTKDDGTVKEELVITEQTVSEGEVKDAAVIAAVDETPEKEDEEPKLEPSETVATDIKEAETVTGTTTEPAVAAQVAAAFEESKIMETLRELKAQLNAKTDKALTEAHRELAKLSSLDMNDLETMTDTQLKVRLVQMAKDMEDQAKWEAVRLQEFLALKEREVEDKYVVINTNY